MLDTEDYRKKREDTLKRLAARLADKVQRSGKRVVLRADESIRAAYTSRNAAGLFQGIYLQRGGGSVPERRGRTEVKRRRRAGEQKPIRRKDYMKIRSNF